MAMIKTKRWKKSGRGKRSEERSNRSARTGNAPRHFVNLKLTEVPFKMRILNKLKPRQQVFDYANPHARFYIGVRKAQLDCKKINTKLIYRKSNKATQTYFYTILQHLKPGPSPINPELIKVVENRPVLPMLKESMAATFNGFDTLLEKTLKVS